jgi:transcription-repair coupling factor (superfamily II helicase)
MAELNDQEILDRLETELQDRFGPPPEAVRNLLFQLKVRLLATSASIERIASEAAQIVIELPEERVVPMLEQISLAIRRTKRGIWMGTLDAGWREDLLVLLEALAEIEIEPTRIKEA